MNLEFHYYTVYWLLAKAGFDPREAETIAYSSQLVDNAIHRYRVRCGRETYETLVTQDYVFWDRETLDGIYLPFHFVPGEPVKSAERRRDGAVDPRAVTPDGPIVRELMVAALKTNDPYRIGIAAHCFADSWAHQNFSARLDPFNALDPKSPLPAVGHLQAFRAPDDPCGAWEDTRLIEGHSRVTNADRFRQAARKLYRYFRTYLRMGFEDEDFVLATLERIWAPGLDAKSARYDLMIDAEIPEYDRKRWLLEAGIRDETTSEAPFSGYDKLLWLKNEVAHRIGAGKDARDVEASEAFWASDYYRWNEAAIAHKALALSIIGETTQ